MARIAVISTANTVLNVIEADSQETATAITGELCLVSDTAGIGDIYDPATGEFVAPVIEEPIIEETVDEEPVVEAPVDAPAPKTSTKK